MPMITVLMSVYNGERFLRESIESILTQTFRDFEFLIINDGSTDKTREIILSYSDPRIRLIDNERNLGLTASLNLGLALATGQLIARQDADDISEPQRLAKQVAFLNVHPEVVLLGTCSNTIDASGQVLYMSTVPYDCDDIRWSDLFFCPFIHSSVIFRKDIVLSQIGPYNEAYHVAQDHELWSRIVSRFPVANLREPLVRYRLHPLSMIASSDLGLVEGKKLSMALIADLLGDRDSTDLANRAERLHRVWHLLAQSSPDLAIDEFKPMLEDMRRLHTAFCKRYNLSEAASRAHRRKVFYSISKALTDTGLRCIDREGDAIRAARFWTMARQPGTHVLWSKRYRWLSLKLLLGPSLVKTAKRLLGRT